MSKWASHHVWTTEQVSFVKDNIQGTSYKRMREMVNEKFNLTLTPAQISGFIKRNGLGNGINAEFEKGKKSWNKGMKGLQLGGEKGWFKKGQKPLNYMPVGTERVNSEGYTDIKVADPSTWKTKHSWMWEKVNGEVPPGHVLIFADGNRSNVTLDNIILISRSQLAILNKNGLIQDNIEATKLAIKVADLHLAIGTRRKELS